MTRTIDQLLVYLHLARASELRRRPLVRDKLLVICGVLATNVGLARIAALCRLKVLEHNHGHMLRRWENFADAVSDDDFQRFHRQLERRYPPEKAEQLLQSLEIDWTAGRAAYYSDEEYAASIWGVTAAQLANMFPDAP